MFIKKMFIRCGISKKTGKEYRALCVDLGYKVLFLGCPQADIAEILGITVREFVTNYPCQEQPADYLLYDFEAKREQAK